MFLKQLRAIFYRNIIVLQGSFAFTILFVVFFLILKQFIHIEDKLTMVVTLVLVIYLFQRILIFNFIEDKILGFKILFRLMGMNNFNYLFAQVLANFFFMNVFMLIGYSVFLCYNYFQVSMFDFWFLSISMLFSVALINFNLMLSMFFRNPTLAADISNMICFVLNLIALVLTLADSEYLWMARGIPNAPYYILLKKLVYDYDNFTSAFIWRECGILLGQAIIYIGIYYYLDILFEDDSGMNRGFGEVLGDMWDKIWNSHSEEDLMYDLVDEGESAAEENIISVRGYTKKFGDKYALQDVNLDFKKGKLYCIMGPNGAGKTTFLNLISGIYKKTSGTLIYKGQALDTDQRIKKIGFCSANNILNNVMTVYQHMKLYSLIKNIDNFDDKMEEILELFNLKKWLHYRVDELSGGNKRKLSIALAYIGQPDTILLDEPSSSLDPLTKKDIFSILLKLQQTKNCTIILTSHDFDEVHMFPDNIMLMSKGKILVDGNLKDLRNYFGVSFELKIIPHHDIQISDSITSQVQALVKEYGFQVDMNLHDVSVYILNKDVDKIGEVYKKIKEHFGANFTCEVSSNLLENVLQTDRMKQLMSSEMTDPGNIDRIIENMKDKSPPDYSRKMSMLIGSRFKLLGSNFVQLTSYILTVAFLVILIGYYFLMMEKVAPDMSLPDCMFIFTAIFVGIEGYNNFSYTYMIVYERSFSIKKLFICNGVTINQYYFSRYIADFIINLITYTLLLILSYVVIDFFIEDAVLDKVALMILFAAIFLWKCCFILVSYFISFIFDQCSFVTKNFNMIYFLFSVGCFTASNLFPYMFLFSDFCYIYEVAAHYSIIKENLFWILFAPFFQICFYLGLIIYMENRQLRYNYENEESFTDDGEVVRPNRSKRLLREANEEFQNDYQFEIKKLKKVYSGDKVSLNKISFKLSSGTCLGLIGPNGAGKSTFFNILISDILKSFGNIYFNRKSDIVPFNTYNFAVTLQKNSLYEEFDVAYHFELYKCILGITNDKIIEDLVDFFGLRSFLKHKVYELTDGVQRKTCMALSLLRRPDFILYDEATTGIDIFNCQLIQKLLKGIEYSFGSIMIVTTHLMREVDFLCDVMGILVDGQFIKYGRVNDIKLEYNKKLVKFLPNSEFNRKEFEDEVGKICKIAYSNRNNEFVKYQTYELSETEKDGDWMYDLINLLQDYKKRELIRDYEITRTSMEDTFISIVKQHREMKVKEVV